MYILINFLVLIIVIFIYTHIFTNIKTSNYLEIYEIFFTSKDKIEDLCNLKQPLLILENNTVFEYLTDINSDFIKEHYSSFDVNVFNKDNLEIPLNILFNKSLELFDKDSSNNYISENNSSFLEDTTLDKVFLNIDEFFTPSSVSFKYHDVIFGGINSYTKLKYSLNCRNYILVNSGSIELTLTLPKNKKYLHTYKSNHNLDVFSSIDIYNVDEKYRKDYNKIKFLRITLTKGQMIHIPAYWFYSIRLLEKNTYILNLQYRTLMNSLSIFPDILIKYIQDNNIKTNFTKIIS